MGKKPQKCKINCQKHHFIMKPVDYFAYISREIGVSFCPPTLRHHPIYPVFNKDKKHYTTSFCLKEDEAKYQNNDAIYKKEHQKFCLQQLNDKSQMLVPKPKSKVPYCHVCKDHYQDYIQHLKTQSHKTCVAQNKFSVYIGQLIGQKYTHQKTCQDNLCINNEQSSCNQKQINSISTLPSCSISDEPQINQGFTFVGGQSLFDNQGGKIWKFRTDNVLQELNQKEVMSPQFQNLLRRCSTTTQQGSQRKCLSAIKIPIIITPMQ